jgi:hypothetical protein
MGNRACPSLQPESKIGVHVNVIYYTMVSVDILVSFITPEMTNAMFSYWREVRDA